MKWIGIFVLYLIPIAYIILMQTSQQPIEWIVVVFTVAMAVGITLYATVLRKYIDDTEENRKAVKKVVKKAIRNQE